jgi:hypothetical protein
VHVSKDGHGRDRASICPSRRRAPHNPQDEVRGLIMRYIPSDLIGFLESADVTIPLRGGQVWTTGVVTVTELLICFALSIASSSSSSDHGEFLSARNPGRLSEAVVSICISST